MTLMLFSVHSYASFAMVVHDYDLNISGLALASCVMLPRELQSGAPDFLTDAQKGKGITVAIGDVDGFNLPVGSQALKDGKYANEVVKAMVDALPHDKQTKQYMAITHKDRLIENVSYHLGSGFSEGNSEGGSYLGVSLWAVAIQNTSVHNTYHEMFLGYSQSNASTMKGRLNDSLKRVVDNNLGDVRCTDKYNVSSHLAFTRVIDHNTGKDDIDTFFSPEGSYNRDAILGLINKEAYQVLLLSD
ncbi:hypothetical protein [uncultured Vibrio sp.]|uniref:hypothetical protein n=1 Tax=uncultured Vibrio sp. TaxID=114054 RepID=UPI0026210273|nr:hypothetical protein [uncultured Vibrio sp.]